MHRDLLLPRTDGGVLAQGVCIGVALGAVAFAVRRRSDLLLLVIGVSLLTLGFFGLRTLH